MKIRGLMEGGGERGELGRQKRNRVRGLKRREEGMRREKGYKKTARDRKEGERGRDKLN